MKVEQIIKAINSSFKVQKSMEAEIAEAREPVVAHYVSTGVDFKGMMDNITANVTNWPEKNGNVIPLGSMALEATRNDEALEWKSTDSFRAVNAFASWCRQRWDGDLKLKSSGAVATTHKSEKDLEHMTMKEIVRQGRSFGLESHGFNPTMKKRVNLMDSFLTAQVIKEETEPDVKPNKLARYIKRVRDMQSAMPSKGLVAEQKAQVMAKFTEIIRILETEDFGK